MSVDADQGVHNLLLPEVTLMRLSAELLWQGSAMVYFATRRGPR